MLFDLQKTELQTRFAPKLTAPQTLVFAELLGGGQTAAREFFDNQLKKQTLRLEAEAAFLEDDDYNALFVPLKPLKRILSTDTQQEIDDKLKENAKIEQES